MKIRIEVLEGPARGKIFAFDRPECFLCGRAADAQISLSDDPFVSRHHFLIEIAPRECRLSDLGSKNGVFVNDVRYGGRSPLEPGALQAENGAKETLLQDGDEIILGDTVMQYTVVQETYPEEGFEEDPMALLKSLLTQADSPASDGSFESFKGYRVIREIGRGGMGTVYKAVDEKTEAYVAIKTMLPQAALDEMNRKFFQREIEITRRLDHPNIARLIDHGYTGKTFYLVLEYVDGTDLESFMRIKGKRLDLDEAASIMLSVSAGLAYAHRAEIELDAGPKGKQRVSGIVHRDLKPQNILMAKERGRWLPKIVDFGLSKSFELAGLSHMTRAGQIAGTPIYWPREQITHYRYLNAASDVFSLAAIFYEMLTGAWVREGFSEMLEACRLQKRSPGIADFMRIIVKNGVIPIQNRNPKIPKPIAAVINRALTEAEIPQDEQMMRRVLEESRYNDAAAFQNALAAAFKRSGVTL